MEVTVPSDASLPRKMIQGYITNQEKTGKEIKRGLGERMSYEMII